MKKKFYVVWVGHKPGIYTSWEEAQGQIHGFKGALFKAFPTLVAAQAALAQGAAANIASTAPMPSKPRASANKPPSSGSNKAAKQRSKAALPPRVPNSISVDAACSGNPGPMEYQGVLTHDGRRIFHQAFPMGTNNIGEFLAIVHALALLQEQGRSEVPIYTDSTIAMGWVNKKQAKTLLKRTPATEKLYQLIGRAEQWLKNNTYSNPIYKWPTHLWGEIPADFGRK